MKKIEAKQEKLAYKEMKAKREWKKPELKVLNLRNTNGGEAGIIYDGITYGTHS